MEYDSYGLCPKKIRFDNCYSPIYTNGTHKTEFDGETMPNLYDKIAEKILAGRSVKTLAQAVHNIYAKKLSIAPLKIIKSNKIEGEMCCYHYIFSTGENRSAILYHDRSLCFGPTPFIAAIIHETKHAQQLYNVHNFAKFGVLPKSDKEKLMLMYNFFNRCSFTLCDDISYFHKLIEIDAFTFGLYEIGKLNEKYPEKFNGLGYYQEMWDIVSRILYEYDYQKNGLNCKGLKKTYKAIKKDIYFSLRGKYGEDMQKLCTRIYESGFNLENAFSDIIRSLDDMYDQIVSLADTVKSLGYRAKFEKNGNLIYFDKKSDLNGKLISPGLNKTFGLMSNDIDDRFFGHN